MRVTKFGINIVSDQEESILYTLEKAACHIDSSMPGQHKNSYEL